MTNSIRHTAHLHNILNKLENSSDITPGDLINLRLALPTPPQCLTTAELRELVSKEIDEGVGSMEECQQFLELVEYHLSNPADAPAAHPEELQFPSEYKKAPEGTIVSDRDGTPWFKPVGSSEWYGAHSFASIDSHEMVRIAESPRKVVRWGKGK